MSGKSVSGKNQESLPLGGVLAALAEPQDVLAKAALDGVRIEHLCCFVDEDAPETDREGAALAVAGLVMAHRQLKDQFERILEDARAFAAYSSMKGATVYECLCTRSLLLGLVAMEDLEAATRIAEERKIRWPDHEIWPEGVPRTSGAAFAAFAADADEKRVGALGQSWLDSGIIPVALEASLRPIFEVLVNFREETTGR